MRQTKYRMKNKVVQQRRSRERELRLKYLKTKELKRDRSKLINSATRLNKEKLRQLEKNKLEKKKELVKNIVEKQEIVKKEKSSKIKRIDDIAFKDGDITENKDYLSAGMYELAKYDKAIIFKFMLNFENRLDKAIDLIDDEGDLLLHINLRENKTIILNSNINNGWGSEIKVEKVLEGQMEFKILVKSDYYKLLLNNKVLSFFIQRKSSKISYT